MHMKLTDVSYGTTSAVITSLAIMIAISGTANSVVTIITALLIIAIADNISDSFGIHITRTTMYNFISRVIVVAVFIAFILLFNMTIAIILSITFGLTVIAVVSYYISKMQKKHDMVMSILKHLLITIAVIIGSFILRIIISRYIVGML